MLQMKPNCWSEHGELEAVMICPPAKVDIPTLKVAEDVQWSAPVQQQKAMNNFLELQNAFLDAGVEVLDYSKELSEEDQLLSKQLLNRFFVRDLACVFGNTILPGDPTIFMREPEYVQAHGVLQSWFGSSFIPPAKVGIHALENGDVLVLNQNAVFINAGLRTSMESVEILKQHIFQAGFSEVAVISVPRRGDTLHLDMNCNVANEDLIIAMEFMRHFPVRVMTEQGDRYEMVPTFLQRHGFEVYWLTEYNSVPDINYFNIDPETILLSKQAHKQMLKKHPKLARKKYIEIDVTELEKAGGGIRCMTLPLRRK
ncbi:arginine deiminase family protein [Oceanobacillus kapialis]|uniref:arginine deiminase family protein n=1 Tax=Oceanobacillus kapialis TaxID=481353 RepID=UPI003850705B